MLDVRRLRVLREVAARGSFSAAADALDYTQSAVSQQIAALEREAGTTLVDRSARGVRLTDAGRALVSHADVVLARLADAEAELEAIAGLRGGRVRLASFPTAGASIMPMAIARFRERHPAVEITMDLAEPYEYMPRLRAGEWDIALTNLATRKDSDDGVEYLHVLDDPMFVALPADHRLARRRTVRLEELADEDWMLGAQGGCPDTSIFLRSCQRAGFEPRIAFHSDDYLAIQGFVAAGMGVSFIPQLALVSVRDDIVIRRLGSQPPVRHVVAATVAGAFRSPAKGAMLDILVEVGAEIAVERAPLELVS